MTTQRHSPAKWILIASAIFAALEIMVSISLWLAPQSFLDMVDFEARGVVYVVRMWAVRQFALGAILAVAAWKRSAPMLTLAYVFLLLMFGGDVLVGLSQNDMAPIVSASIMCAVSASVIFAINKK